ncbi:hypothetical protein FAY30_20665 [Bacillus sp. S3]|uniref:hypothetical protein n=1 Tax=Bacillus sp. S3 TaxID=486398 RepID=UPI00118C536E|nr:hypothetical protein [Bacillus sp. S3]QCJ44125.1 hypothetical protein FAY30_20665 [Bacillus sp. S3]
MKMKDLTPPQRLFLTEILKGRIDVRHIFDVFKQLIRPIEDGTGKTKNRISHLFPKKVTPCALS